MRQKRQRDWRRLSHLLKLDTVGKVDRVILDGRLPARLQVHWLGYRSRLLGGNFRAVSAGFTASGTRLFQAIDDSSGIRSYFTSPRQASYYGLGARARATQLASSYALPSITFRRGDWIIDCGANYGDLRLYLWSLPDGLELHYVGIEPGRDEFECLARNVVSEGDLLLNCALGETNRTATFYYDPQFASSSLERPPSFIDQYEVEIRTLDDIISQQPLEGSRIRLLKLEAEGTEPEVLMGARNSLARIDYIAADLGFERGTDQQSTAPQVINFLLARHFELVKVGSAGDLRFLFRNLNTSTG